MKSIIFPAFSRRLTLALIVGQLLCGLASAATKRFMIETLVRGTALEGAPLTWSDERVVLLGRDGRLVGFFSRRCRELPQDHLVFRSVYATRNAAAARDRVQPRDGSHCDGPLPSRPSVRSGRSGPSGSSRCIASLCTTSASAASRPISRNCRWWPSSSSGRRLFRTTRSATALGSLPMRSATTRRRQIASRCSISERASQRRPIGGETHRP